MNWKARSKKQSIDPETKEHAGEAEEIAQPNCNKRRGRESSGSAATYQASAG
jgi:hypothetical protein